MSDEPDAARDFPTCDESKHSGPFDRFPPGKGFGLTCQACGQDLCGATWQPYGLIEGRCLLPHGHDGGHEAGTHPQGVEP